MQFWNAVKLTTHFLIGLKTHSIEENANSWAPRPSGKSTTTILINGLICCYLSKYLGTQD